MTYYTYGNNNNKYSLNENENFSQDPPSNDVFKKFNVFMVRFLHKLDPQTLKLVEQALAKTSLEEPYFDSIIQNVLKTLPSSKQSLKQSVQQPSKDTFDNITDKL